MRGRRHTMLTVTTIGAAAVATLLPGGCSSGGASCTTQSVTVQSVTLPSVTSAFDLTATVKSPDSKPLSGVSVQFWAWGTPPGKSSSVGVPLGTTTTDASGRAMLKMPPIIRDHVASTLEGIAGTRFVEVSAKGLAGPIGGTAYCEGKGSAPVTCGAAGQGCPAVVLPKA